ncbi:hypothetical protein ABD74_02650 [Brevibacillus laterosporus]|nr:hypothetical protein [Brevibacillus laterosporus]
MILLAGIQLGATEVEEFSLEEVNYVDLYNKTKNSKNGILRYHTNKGTFLALTKLEDARQFLEKYGFQSLDSVNVVNLNAIKYIVEDPFSIKAYFQNGTYTSISKFKYKLLSHLNIPKKDQPD